MNNKLRSFINIILISVLSIGIWEICKKQWNYHKDKEKYQIIQNEKETTDNIQEYLNDKEFDWITVTNTAIDYPLVQYTDNEYYTTHDYEGNESIGGAIYYDAFDDPFNGKITTIYGHSMKNGTMFNNLHYFQKDKHRFKDSRLTIDTEESSETYVPLAYYVTCDNKFYKQLDDSSITDIITAIKLNCDYFVPGVEYSENSHIVVLFTCDYSVDDGRLVVFYISE